MNPHRQPLSLNRGIALLAIIVISIAGVSLLHMGHAATTASSVQAESGTINSPAVKISDSTGSGASSIAFRAATVSPPSTAKPDATNTGYQHTGTSLTVINGDQTYAIDNQVISGLDVHGTVIISGKNVTFKNSIIRGHQSQSDLTSQCNASHNSAVLQITGTGSAVIQDSEISPTYMTSCIDGVWLTNATLLRDNIHGTVDAVKTYDNSTIQDSYIHDLLHYASQPNGGGETHNDAAQTYTANQNINILHNNLDLDTNENSDLQVTQDGYVPAKNIHVDNNWLYGGGCTINIAVGKTTQSAPPPNITAANNITITNNRFGPNGYTNCNILIGTKVALTSTDGNVLDATGGKINISQHD